MDCKRQKEGRRFDVSCGAGLKEYLFAPIFLGWGPQRDFLTRDHTFTTDDVLVGDRKCLAKLVKPQREK
jgi:hypothetical protein